MREILKCYGHKEELETRLRISKPELEAEFYGKHMDTTIVFEDISEDDFDETLELLDDCIYNDRDISLA
ncbi:MAG: hypothetical protein PHC84_04615, partial [Clostridia bacterium]|nr:hypothetical protein [Clostridia bacterium]